MVGYFSKEKCSEEGYNLACILALPAWQKRVRVFNLNLNRFEGVMVWCGFPRVVMQGGDGVFFLPVDGRRVWCGKVGGKGGPCDWQGFSSK